MPDNTETEAVTDPESTPDTDAVTDPETNSETETETEPADAIGCKAIAGGAVLMAVICLGALMLGKKKD